MPKEYDASNPMAEYLKMKEYIMCKRVTPDYFDCDDWVERVAQDFKRLQPLYDFLNYVFDWTENRDDREFRGQPGLHVKKIWHFHYLLVILW